MSVTIRKNPPRSSSLSVFTETEVTVVGNERVIHDSGTIPSKGFEEVQDVRLTGVKYTKPLVSLSTL